MDTLITRSIGVELEVKGGRGNTPERTATAIERAGVDCHSEGYNHTTRNHWKIVPDGSLGTGGFEIVSPVLHSDTVAQIDTVCATINARSTTVDRQCGFHLHIGIADLTFPELARLCKGLAKYERLVGYLCPQSRRAGSYSAFNLSNDGVSVDEQTHFRRIDQITADWKAGRIDENIARRTLFALAQPRGRFSFFNLQNMLNANRGDTIEIRVHSGTTDALKIRNWARFWNLAIDAFKCTNFRASKLAKTHNTKHGGRGELTVDKEIRRLFKVLQKATNHDLKALRSYYQGRAKSVGSISGARTSPIA